MLHPWTEEGVAIEAAFTGGHLYHLAAAGCVLNDLCREAKQLGISLQGVQVRAEGGFDTSNWTSTGIEYVVEIASPSGSEQIDLLLAVVDDVAEIPKALRVGTTVTRTGAS